MKTISKIALLRCSVAPVILGAALISAPVMAQETPQAADDAAAGDAIVVTGSLIRNPNLERSTPVTATTADAIELKANNTAEEVLREIPGIVPSIGSAVNNGNGGASFVNLRGLGSNRNIVLLDGVRLTPAELQGRFDLNNIPLALIERVDVLTGGASTTYGADAISGVVNFVTKQRFTGLEANASQQLTERGDGNVFRTDVTLGADFDDGRGNVVFSIGYQQADPVYQGARPFSSTSINSFDVNDTVSAGSPTATPSSFTVPGVGTRQIDESGALVAPFASFNFNPYNIFQTPFERYNMYGAGSYEVSDAIEVYTRGLFSKNTVQTIIAPSGIFNSVVTVPVSNPYLPTAARNTFCANNDFNTAVAGIQTLTPAQCAAAALATDPTDPNYRTFTTGVRRRTTEVGPRISEYQTVYFDYKLGARGAITDAINWDVFGSYGESQNTQTLKGYVSLSRVRQAVLATNTTSCLNTTGDCVPLNIFGPSGSITNAQGNFVEVESNSVNRFSLAQARGTISGEVGIVSPFASDKLGFAVGTEYRKYKATQQSDLLSQTAGELGGAGGAAPNINGGFEVYEAFGELILPLVQDKPFFESLTVEGGVRYSSYKVFAEGQPTYKTTTYKAGGSWEPGAGVKVRGNYSHAVRAPNINELFAPISTGLTNLSIDPCAGANPLNNANLRAVCLAQGAPAFTIGNIEQPAAGQAASTGGGNPNLKPEKSNSYTVGLVYQPEFVNGLSMTVDYYNIKVTDAVSSPTPGDAILACFGATPTTPSAGAATSSACTAIRRNPSTGALDGDPADTPGLFLTQSNLGKLATDGIDLTINYSHDIGFANLGLSFVGNWTNKSTFQASPTSINRDCVGYYSSNCPSIQPEFQFSQRTTLGFEAFDISLLWRYIDNVRYEDQQFADDLAGAVAAGCADPAGADPDGCVVDSQFRSIKAEHYFDLSGRFNANDNLTFTLTVQNLLDNKPKVVGNNLGSTSYNSGNIYPSTYDSLGRRYAVSAKLRF